MSKDIKKYIISDILRKPSFLPIISLKNSKNELPEEAKKVLAYQRKIQSQPKIIDLRHQKETTRLLVKDYIIKIKPGFEKATYLSRTVPRYPAPIHRGDEWLLNKTLRFDLLKCKARDLLNLGKYKTADKKIDSKNKKFFTHFIFPWRLAPFLVVAVLAMFSIKSLASIDDDLKFKKDKILGEVNIASQYLNSGKDSLLESDFQIASYKFKVAGERFIAAQKQINFLEKSLANILQFLPNREISSSLNLLEAGGSVSFAAENLSQVFLRFQNTQDIFASFKNKQNEDGKISFTSALIESSRDLGLANFRLSLAKRNLDKVDINSLPYDRRQEIEEIKKTVPQLQESVSYFLDNLNAFLEILGHNQPKKYILFFANSHELRPSGGFLGTYGLFDVNEGRIENLKLQSPYVVSGQLKEKYKAPEPLRLIQSKFNFHDANWFFDFPTSAKKISLLHEKAGFPTVDGIIVITSGMMPEILKIIGPISMPEYGTEITAENFFDTVQREVEIEYDKELNEPKKFIADFFPKIFERIFNLDKSEQTKILQIFLRELFGKNILIYFRDERLEKMVQDFGFGGEVKTTSGDYLAVVSTNIGGGKTDHVIDQKIELQTEILPEGKVINTLTIKRSHNGELRDFWTSIKNMTFLRIYVPLGSKLISAQGFDTQFFNPDILVPYEEGLIPDPDIEAIEKTTQIHELSKTRIYQEGTKTVFGNWQGLEVGQSKTVVIKYELPFDVKLSSDDPALSRYNLFVERQGGTQPFSFVSELYFPQNFSIIWQYTKDKSGISVFDNKINYETKLSQDRGYGVVFTNKD
ncbi:MAG: DUF4012 domain-containing protein [Patescibacteria group bacterium]